MSSSSSSESTDLQGHQSLRPRHQVHAVTGGTEDSRVGGVGGDESQERQRRLRLLRQARIEVAQLERAIKDIKCGESLGNVSDGMKSPEWTVTFQHANYTLTAVKVGWLMLNTTIQAQASQTQTGARTGTYSVDGPKTYTSQQYKAIMNETMARMRCGVQIEDALRQAKEEVEAGRV
ncbi:hypothetical protein H2204_007542 [Knufia peltigerae]|uniref:Uncharacterized protein n=1 Tax=Knufia peltigerae TaxID=1002370 RepID=A0AA38Y339_9EURO|nr:hypothetical protein H2204_007542 [Knufia peltigerae]